MLLEARAIAWAVVRVWALWHHCPSVRPRVNSGVVVRYVIAVSGALLIGGSAFSPPAQAQAMCGERRAVVANLEKTYSEAPVSIGLVACIS